MFLEDLALHLEQSDCGIRGRSIFIHFLSASDKIAVLIKDAPHGVEYRKETGNYRRARYMLAVRHTDPVLGHALAQRVFKALDVSEQTWPTVKLIQMTPVSEPQMFPLSSAQLVEWAIVFDASFALIT